MVQMTLTAEQRVDKCVSDLLDFPGLECVSGVMMMGTRSMSSAVPTAATDGLNEFYNDGFVDKLNDAECRGLVLHENFHKMPQHLIIYDYLHEKDPQCANMAMDYVINLWIDDIRKQSNGYIQLPDGGLLDEKYRDLDTDQVFDLRYEEKQKNGDPGGSGEPLDSHDWENAKAMSPEEQADIKEQIDQAVRQGKMRAERRAGEGAGGPLDDVIDTLLRPKVDWRAALRRFVRGHCKGLDRSTFRKPRRRMAASGIYMSSHYSERVDEVMIAEDTSGSTASFRQKFRSEAAGIVNQVKPKTAHYVQWDSAVENHEVVTEGTADEVRQLKAHGGGGTDVECLATYLKDEGLAPKVVVILTDGFLSRGWGEWPKGTAVLWCIYGNRRAVPTCGTTIHIDRE